MKLDTCINCRYWQPLDGEAEDTKGNKVPVGQCRFNAPTSTAPVFAVNPQMLKRPMFGINPTLWPITAGPDWCGKQITKTPFVERNPPTTETKA